MNTADSFWRTVPRTSLVVFLLGVFFIFSVIGSAVDIIHMGRQPVVRYALSVFLFGAFAILYAAAGFVLRGKFWRAFFPIIIVEMLLIGWLLPDLPEATQMSAADLARLQSRLVLSGSATIAGMVLGYVCFIYVFISEGRRYFGVHAEMALASEIHRVLVPAIDTKIGNFEFCGRSLPSGQVGGDLIDVVQNGRGWIAYVADVSGHGVAPGVVMGMVKSAARMQLSSKGQSAELLQRLHGVLYPIKKPEMFVTFAYLAWNGEGVEYSLAGHPAILHYQAATKRISALECSNLPLGIFEQQEFVNGSAPCAAGDVFLLLTDGLIEVTNARDEEFGLDRVKEGMSAQAGSPLAAMLQAILDSANRHGRAADDQSLLAVRCHLDTP